MRILIAAIALSTLAAAPADAATRNFGVSGFDRIRVDGPFGVSIGTHELTAAWLNGAGTLAIDKLRGFAFDLSVRGSGAASVAAVEVDQLKVAVSGTAAVGLTGSALKLTATVLGVSTFEARALTTKDATIEVNGAGTVRATVTETAKVTAQGPAA